jgi:hypothetical protein
MVCRFAAHRMPVLSILCAAIALWYAPALAQEKFASAEEAASALVGAVKTGDAKAILAVLGPDGEAIVSSGDPVADSNAREKFVAAYDAKHTLELEGNGTQTLILGDEGWPFPVPLANKAGEWQFDTKAGLEEILHRRVGRNELAAIEVARGYVQAQNEYAESSSGGRAYAQRIVSSPGKKDGLYWPTGEAESSSPLGDLIAKASAEGYKVGQGPIPYHGYFYRILKGQSGNAAGGAYDYVVDGKMIGGFALVAYPAEYGNSGIMTFMVNHDGTVFQKDLGPDTGKLARKIESFAPDQTWTKVDATG